MNFGRFVTICLFRYLLQASCDTASRYSSEAAAVRHCGGKQRMLDVGRRRTDKAWCRLGGRQRRVARKTFLLQGKREEKEAAPLLAARESGGGNGLRVGT